MSDDLLSTEQAAEYIGLSIPGLKHHLYTVKDLKPDAKIGQALVFRRSTLDEFLERKRDPGRPPSGESL